MTPERELQELRSKVEEFRKELAKRPEEGVRLTYCEPCAGALEDTFNELFPPPKKGCWGFFRDYRKEPYRKESGLTGRMFESCEDEDHANRVRDCFDSMNPGKVFFLEEK